MTDYLAIPSFTGRTKPAVLIRQGDRYAYHDDAAPGFIGADISRWDDGWRLHVYAPGNLCRYIAQLDGDSPAGTYTQVEKSAYNVELGQPTVEVVESNAESAEKALDEAAASESAVLRRAGLVHTACSRCPHQSGFPSQYKVRCAKSSASCGCISLLRGACPESRWLDVLVGSDAVTPADVTPDISVDRMIAVIDSGFMRWPPGWYRWENTKEAHRQLMTEAVENIPANPYAASGGAVNIASA